MKDLIIPASDKDLEFALRGLLARPQALGIRPIDADIFVDPLHDPACALRGVPLISGFANQYRYGLLMFDHEGSGRETTSPQELADRLNAEFARSAWGARARAIVLVPELEAWIWSDSPHVDDAAGWKNRNPGLRPWLIDRGWLCTGKTKPVRPKEAFEAALREARTPRSASLYERIARTVSLRRCRDSSFRELRTTLTNWFPPDSTGRSK